MAYPVCIDFPENTVPPTDGEDSIKHVEFNGKDENDFRPGYRKLEKTLLFEFLRRREGSLFPECLMAVSFNTRMTQNENNNFCSSVLKRSIFCEGKQYRFLGHSDNQLREKECFLMGASEGEIHDLLAAFGDFLKIKDVARRASRIGLFFVPFNLFLELGEDDFVIEPDAKGGVFAFTNGCGFMSPRFSTEVRRHLGVDYPEPSVVQVSYQGFQGALVLKEAFTSVPRVQFRKSMQQFSTPKEMHVAIPLIGIVDHSKPYINGYLDSRLIMFLAIRGVSTAYLKSLQTDYLDLLNNMCTNPAYGKYFCHLTGRNAPTDRKREVLASLRQDEVEKMIDYVNDQTTNDDEPQRRRVTRTRMLVPKSRVAFGVCDPYSKLRRGECYFKPTIQHDEEFEEIVVAPYPCFHPGDIQVLKLTPEKLEYENLKDCLVLPVNHSHEFEYSGASKFFVSWDQNLVPQGKKGTSCRYSPTWLEMQKEKVSEALYAKLNCLNWSRRNKRQKDREKMIHYFAHFTDNLPRRIDELYLKFAEADGPFSKECQDLSKMHYQAINLTADRDTLSKRLAKMEKKRPTGLSTSVDSPTTDGTPLLRGEGEGDNENVAHIKPDGITARLRREFDERSKKFVEEFYGTDMNEHTS